MTKETKKKADAACADEVREEEADGDALAAHGRAVHDLELGDRLRVVVHLRARARGLAADDRELHVLDLDADEQEVDLADDDVVQVVLRLVVLELDVEALLDAHLHLDRVVDLGRRVRLLNEELLLLDHVARRVMARDRHADKVSQPHVQPVIALVGLLDGGEVEGVVARLVQCARLRARADREARESGARRVRGAARVRTASNSRTSDVKSWKLPRS